MAESIYKFLMQDALSTGGGQDDALKDKKGDMEKEDNRRTNKKSLQQRVGIQLTLAGILKQSSIFTGFIGSLFQIVGAFVDTLLMGFFPLLKGGLKFIMKFFDPLKKAAAGIGTIVEFVMKIFSKIGDVLNFGRGGDSEDLLGQAGNPLSGLRTMDSKVIGSKYLKGLGLVGTALKGFDFLSAFAEPDDLDKAVKATQSAISIAVGSAIMAGAGALAVPTFGTSVPVGIGAVTGYELYVAPMIDAAIKDFFYAQAGRAQEDAAYSQGLTE